MIDEGHFRPAKGARVTEHELAGDTILYCPAADRVVSLNQVAAYVWSLCDGDHGLEDLARAVRQRTGWPAREAEREVRRMIASFVREGFLRDPSRGTELLTLTFAGTAIELEIECLATASALASRFRHFLGAPGDRQPSARFEIVGSDQIHFVACGRWSENHQGPFADRLRAIEGRIVERITQLHPELVWIHAGAVTDGEGAVLLSGPTGCGKSRISVDLLGRGWKFAGDDLVGLREAARLEPFPLAPVVRRAIDVELPENRLHELARIQAEVRADAVAGETPVGLVVFPTYQPGSSERAVALTPTQALMLLVRQCTTFRRQRDRALQALIAVLERAPAFRLNYRTSAGAAELVTRLMAEAGDASVPAPGPMAIAT